MHIDQHPCFVLPIHEIDRAQVALVGGKAAHLGALARADDVRVPPGFCVTTEAFQRALAGAPGLDEELGRLAGLTEDDHVAIRDVSAGLRRAVEAVPVPHEVATAVTAALARLDGGADGGAWAVRSSATAEDLPTASFAGQHDSHLDVVGPSAVLEAIGRVWASLFTERAVAYRLRHGVDHRTVAMAVVVQRMVHPLTAGVLFTADPVTSNRRVAAVEATAGLGEDLVSGLVTPDAWTVRDEAVLTRVIAGDEPTLTDAEVVDLVRLGRRIEEHLGMPQDIEWCLADDGVHVVQSRPITTLFPIPEVDDDAVHVWLSVGHQQMMTDAMRPLGISMWQMAVVRPMDHAGGRLFVDVTAALRSPAGRAGLLTMMGRSDPLLLDALETLLDRDLVPLVPDPPGTSAAPPTGIETPPIETDPAIVAGLVARNRESVAALARAMHETSGPAVFDLILEDVPEGRRLLFEPLSHAAIMAGMEATWWLDEHLQEWLGETNAADALSLSVPHDITAEMGLALLDVADAIRPHPEVVALLEQTDEGFLDRLPAVAGGDEARRAIDAYLDAYGMRGVGEIDITRPRWSEQPRTLVPMILAHVRSFGPGEAARRFEEGRRRAEATAADLVARLRALPDGDRKAAETERMIDRLRTFAGYREYPKYGKISRELVYKRALVAEAERLVRAGVLDEVEDAFFLTFPELHDAARTHRVDRDLIARRREAFRSFEALTPPRVLTSEGEALSGAYRRDDLPARALVGLAVSGGTVEGRARVVRDMADAALEPGDILVTVHTDPSWSPLFVSAHGLVTEVGGKMTHGAVIAREYGLPAVVGVGDATHRIEDGQRIRVDGTSGIVEILDAPE